MRNRAATPPRDENAFINGGTAGVDKAQPLQTAKRAQVQAKAKPVSISFSEDNLSSIDLFIREEALADNPRVNRSDVVRAAVIGLAKIANGETLSKTDIPELIKLAKLK